MNVLQTNSNLIINPIEAKNTIGVSDKYKRQDSQEVINFFENQGFTLEETSFANLTKKNKHKEGFQKHVMIFNKPDLKIDNENILRFLVTNSHDGSTSFKIDIGIFRLVCANGLVVGDTMHQYRIQHKGNDFYDQVAATLQDATQNAPQIIEQLKRYKSINLNENQMIELARNCAQTRLKDVDNVTHVDFNSLLRTRRNGDAKTDLYTTFNRIQESIIRGHGLYTTIKDNKVQTKRMRKIKSISKRIELNKELWQNMDKIAA